MSDELVQSRGKLPCDAWQSNPFKDFNEPSKINRRNRDVCFWPLADVRLDATDVSFSGVKPT